MDFRSPRLTFAGLRTDCFILPGTYHGTSRRGACRSGEIKGSVASRTAARAAIRLRSSRQPAYARLQRKHRHRTLSASQEFSTVPMLGQHTCEPYEADLLSSIGSLRRRRHTRTAFAKNSTRLRGKNRDRWQDQSIKPQQPPFKPSPTLILKKSDIEAIGYRIKRHLKAIYLAL